MQFNHLRQQWLGAGGQPVPSEQSQRRADVCLKCPHNVKKPLTELFAGAAATIVQQQLQMRSQMQMDVTGEEHLHICEKCGCVLRLKVHAPLKFILENTDTEGLPPWCWIRVEQQQAEGSK